MYYFASFLEVRISNFYNLLQDLEVVNMCLGALKALASYHYRETCAGKAGLGSHAAGQGSLPEGIFSRFLRSLLQLLLFEDYRYLFFRYHSFDA